MGGDPDSLLVITRAPEDQRSFDRTRYPAHFIFTELGILKIGGMERGANEVNWSMLIVFGDMKIVRDAGRGGRSSYRNE